MSCNVLVIPEDPTKDQHILQPLVSRLLRECGKGNAKVIVLRNPRLRGFEDACGQLPLICDTFSHFDLLLFLPDADGKDRSLHFAQLEAEAEVKLICCAAVEEVEAWLLAGHVDKLDRPWAEVRADISVKANVFAPFLARYGDRSAGQGREALMREALRNLRGLLDRCPELAVLQQRICAALA